MPRISARRSAVAEISVLSHRRPLYGTGAIYGQSVSRRILSSGTSAAAIIDLLMAGAMIGEGTSYPGLTYTVALNSEEYGVGFRKGSDLTDQLNAFLKTYAADGSLLALAKEYGLQEAVITG